MPAPVDRLGSGLGETVEGTLARISAIIDAGIPVMGHIGLTPQSATMLGGYRAQGRTAAAALAAQRALGLEVAVPAEELRLAGPGDDLLERVEQRLGGARADLLDRLHDRREVEVVGHLVAVEADDADPVGPAGHLFEKGTLASGEVTPRR